MNAEFNWWLLIVGLVVGAGLVWLVVADSRRREVDVSAAEREGEAHWIAATMTDVGQPIDDADVLDILRLHAAYLAASPPDESFDEKIEGGLMAGTPDSVAIPETAEAASDVGKWRPMAHPSGAPERHDREGGSA